MRLRVLGFLVGAGVLALVNLVAEASAMASPLSGKELRRALAGKTIYLSTPLGISVPIRYRANGTMVGRAKAVLVRYVGSPRDRGVWWISGNRLCQRWGKWLDGRAYCYSFRKKGRTVYWRRNDGRTGTAVIAQ